MLKNNNGFFHEHRHVLIRALAVFIFLVAITSGPILVHGVMTISAQRAAEIQQKNSAIDIAILNNDYYAWRDLVTDEKLKSQINAQNFPQFAEAYRLLQQGKLEEANIIKRQMELKQEFDTAAAKSRAIEQAILNNDYTAWRAAVGNQEPRIHSGNFSTYASAFRLIMDGRLSQAGFAQRRLGIKINPYSSGR